MPVDFSNADDLPGSNPARSEFGTTPIWDRPRSRRSRFKSSASPSATAAATTTTASRDFTPRRTESAGSGGVPTWAIVAVPAAIVIAGGAFFLTQGREPTEPPMTVAEMDTPAPAAPTVATMKPAPELAPTPATDAAVHAAEPARTEPTRAEPTRVARARPAPRAPAADESSADASTIAPMPTPAPAAAQANPLAVNPAPLVVPTPAQPATTTDAAPPAEVGGTTQEAVPDSAAVPQ